MSDERGRNAARGRKPARHGQDAPDGRSAEAVPLPPGRGIRPPTPPDRYRYSMAELEEATGLPQRTIRFYVAEGLIPPAHGRGPSSTYDQSHYLRLMAIQRRRGQNMPLQAIKEELGDRTDEEIAAELRFATEPPEDRWRRIVLHPNIELHVREPGGERDHRLDEAVAWIVDLARPVIDRLESER
jgi:DNA-binding transcriptional MerR regulator